MQVAALELRVGAPAAVDDGNAPLEVTRSAARWLGSLPPPCAAGEAVRREAEASLLWFEEVLAGEP